MKKKGEKGEVKGLDVRERGEEEVDEITHYHHREFMNPSRRYVNST